MYQRWLFPLVLMVVSYSVLFAQARKAVPESISDRIVNSHEDMINRSEPELTPRNVVDTLLPGAFNDVCGPTQVVYPVGQGWGFIAGTNTFMDREKAQLMENTTNTTVTIQETWAFFGYVSQVGNGNVRMKIYQVNPTNGSPDFMIAQSNDVRVEDIQYEDNAFLATPFTFPTNVDLDDPSFFLSLDISSLYSTFDTVALFHSELGCGVGREAYDQLNDGRWFSVDEAWLTEEGNFEINYSLMAIVEFDGPSNVRDPYYQQGRLRLYPATPNPARETVLLNYELEQPGSVQIQIYSAAGRRIQLLDLGLQGAGRYAKPVNIDALPAGAYVYTIITEGGRVASRFVVN